MKKLTFTLSLLFILFVGCSKENNPTANESESTINKNDRIAVNPDSLYYGDFVGTFQTSTPGNPGVFMSGTSLQILSGDLEQGVSINLGASSATLSAYWSDGIMSFGNGKISSNETIKFNAPSIEASYNSSLGNAGRTARREITDKDGNVHAFVFENGLFVDELLNGVSVFK